MVCEHTDKLDADHDDKRAIDELTKRQIILSK